MPTLLTLAFLLPLPFFRATPRTDQAAWRQLLVAFSQRGVTVTSDHPRCRESNLYGLYVRGSRTVVVCERGDRSATLRHEGWHLVQSPGLPKSVIKRLPGLWLRLRAQAFLGCRTPVHGIPGGSSGSRRA